MGNRAVITTENSKVGVYVHWNGGRDSVEAFLKYCELKGYRTPDSDCYGWARLCQVIGNFFGGSTSVGIDVVDKLDCNNYDNGTYVIKGWQIVAREYFDGIEQHEYDLVDMLKGIDSRMPESEQLGEQFFDAEIVQRKEIEVGDSVYIQDFTGKYFVAQVVGVGEEGKRVNGADVGGVPYVDYYGSEPQNNINNYIWNNYASCGTAPTDTIRRLKK